MSDCLISLDSYAVRFTTGATVAGKFVKAAQFGLATTPAQFKLPNKSLVIATHVSGIATTLASRAYMIVDNGAAVGTQLGAPQAEVVHAHSNLRYPFPLNHGMKIETTQFVGIYVYSESNGGTIDAIAHIFVRPYSGT